MHTARAESPLRVAPERCPITHAQWKLTQNYKPQYAHYYNIMLRSPITSPVRLSALVNTAARTVAMAGSWLRSQGKRGETAELRQSPVTEILPGRRPIYRQHVRLCSNWNMNQECHTATDDNCMLRAIRHVSCSDPPPRGHAAPCGQRQRSAPSRQRPAAGTRIQM